MKIKIQNLKMLKAQMICIRLIKKKILSHINFSENKLKVGEQWEKMGFQKEIYLYQFFLKLIKKKLILNNMLYLNAYLLKRLLSKYYSNKIKIKWPNDLLIKKKKFVGFCKKCNT